MSQTNVLLFLLHFFKLKNIYIQYIPYIQYIHIQREKRNENFTSDLGKIKNIMENNQDILFSLSHAHNFILDIQIFTSSKNILFLHFCFLLIVGHLILLWDLLRLYVLTMNYAV